MTAILNTLIFIVLVVIGFGCIALAARLLKND